VAGEERVLKNFMICTDIMKRKEMGWECSTYGEKNAHTRFCYGNLRK
jgi:hypothetical protein